MAILFTSSNVKIPPIKRSTTKKWIALVAEKYGKRVGEVSYLFCSDEEILKANNQFLGHDFYTDIITFDNSENDLIAGDIMISTDTVKSNSEKFDTQFIDEVYRVIIHGILHLCGLKDKTAAEQKAMREAENNAISMLMTML